MIFDNTSDAVAEQASLTKYYTGHGGKILQAVSLTPPQASYRTEVSKAFATKPHVVFFKLDPQNSPTLFCNMKEAGDPKRPGVREYTATKSHYTEGQSAT